MTYKKTRECEDGFMYTIYYSGFSLEVMPKLNPATGKQERCIRDIK
jgi:hypothetical protein